MRGKCARATADGGECFFRAMQPAEKFQRIVFERLHAERYAIDSRRAVAAENDRPSTLVGFASSVISISGVSGQCQAIWSRIAPTVAGCIKEGVPPPEKNAVDGTPPGPCRRFRKLGGDGAGKPFFIGLLVGAHGC